MENDSTDENELIAPEQIAQLDKLFSSPIDSDDDYLQLAEDFPEDE